MEAGSGCLIAAAVLFAAISGIFAGPCLAEMPANIKRRGAIKTRLSKPRLHEHADIAIALLDAASAVAASMAATGNGWSLPMPRAIYGKLAPMLKRAGIEPNRNGIAVFGVSCTAIASAITLAVTNNLPMAFAVGAVSPAILFPAASREAARRKHLLKEQLPSALRAIGMSLSAGHSLPQAFEHAADATEQPLSRELGRVVWDIDAGKSVDEAIGALRMRTDISELSFLSIACTVQHRSGGSLSEVLDAASDSIKSSLSTERSLEVQTAQARLSARVVAAMPAILLVVLAMASPGYLADLVSQPAGIYMLVIAGLLDFAGLAAIKRIVAIRM